MARFAERRPADSIAIRNDRFFKKLARFQIALDDVLAHQLIDLFGEFLGGSIFGDSWHVRVTGTTWEICDLFEYRYELRDRASSNYRLKSMPNDSSDPGPPAVL